MAVGDDVWMRGVAVMIVLDGGGVHLSLASPVDIAGSPVGLGRLNRGPAAEGQDLEGPLGDRGQVGVALLVAADVVDVVTEETAITLRRDIRNRRGIRMGGEQIYLISLLD